MKNVYLWTLSIIIDLVNTLQFPHLEIETYYFTGRKIELNHASSGLKNTLQDYDDTYNIITTLSSINFYTT